MRKIIFHYHLFKNAGSSLDQTFKEELQEGIEWLTKEFPAQANLNREQTKNWIKENTQGVCFSSHSAILPPPTSDEFQVIPVIFFRHPIDRIASAYAFERKQGGDSFGAVLARNTSLAGYIETRLSLQNDRQCRNFHAHRFASMYGEKVGSEQERATLAIRNLPFVGLVERYYESLTHLNKILLQSGFENISLKEKRINVSQISKKSLDEKLDDVNTEIGEPLFSRLMKENESDFYLYNETNEKLKSMQ